MSLKQLQQAYKKEFKKAEKSIMKVKQKKCVSITEGKKLQKDTKVLKAAKKSDWK